MKPPNTNLINKLERQRLETIQNCARARLHNLKLNLIQTDNPIVRREFSEKFE